MSLRLFFCLPLSVILTALNPRNKSRLKSRHGGPALAGPPPHDFYKFTASERMATMVMSRSNTHAYLFAG